MSDESNHNALYDVPVEILNLSESALQSIKRLGVTSIGDCIDHFLRKGGLIVSGITPDFMEAMHNEVKQKLAEHGYGTFD